MRLVAVIGLTTRFRHGSMNYKKATDEDFVVKVNAVRTYSIVYDLCDFRSEKQACAIANGLFGQLHQLCSLYDLGTRLVASNAFCFNSK